MLDNPARKKRPTPLPCATVLSNTRGKPWSVNGAEHQVIDTKTAAGMNKHLHDGFFDTVVAAPSQAAALRAWGTRQNLFASGDARVTTNEASVAAALEHPETPLRRAVGSDAPFELEPTSLPEVPDPPNPKPGPKPRGGRPTKPPPPAADRSELNAAEAKLRQLDEARKAEEAAFRREEEALESRKADAQATYVDARKAATAAVVDARQAYRKAGGSD